MKLIIHCISLATFNNNKMSSPSATYKFAKNPKAAIKTAVRRQLEEISDNPRISWTSITSKANISKEGEIHIDLFVSCFKSQGTGIQLTACDMDYAWPELNGFVNFQSFRTMLQ